MAEDLDAFVVRTGTRPADEAAPEPTTPEEKPPAIGAPQPIALIYPSRKGGSEGHAVVIRHDGSLSCTCPGGLFAERGCWAMKRTRELLNL